MAAPALFGVLQTSLLRWLFMISLLSIIFFIAILILYCTILAFSYHTEAVETVIGDDTFIISHSLAKPDPKREARASGDKPIPTFVPQYVILYVRLHNA